MIKRCGGSRDLYTRISEEILINILFKDDKSPAKRLEFLMKQYIEHIVKLFRDIINEIDFSNTQLDPAFWTNLKDKLIQDIDKKYVIDGLQMLCSAQESYFDFEDDSITGLVGDEVKETKETKGRYVLHIMAQIWKKYMFVMRLQFGKYIQKHLIEYNLSDSKMDAIFYKPEHIEALTRFLKEPDETERRRIQLDKNIEKLKALIEVIKICRV